MLEKELEKKLVAGVKALGGKAYKFVSPGNIGVPDRLIIMPGGYIEFIELKTETGRLSTAQCIQCGKLLNLGCRVQVLRGAEDVKNYLIRLTRIREEL